MMRAALVLVCGLWTGSAQAACSWSGSASDFFRCMMGVSEEVDEQGASLVELNARVAAAEDATWALSDVVLSAGEVLDTVASEGFALLTDIAPVGLTGSFLDLADVPFDLLDGDDDTLDMLFCDEGEVPVTAGGGWVCGERSELTMDAVEALIESEMSDLLERIDGLESGAPGLVGSGVMYGDYYIYNSVDLANLAGFTEVTGTLGIFPGSGMPALDGLDSLTRVGGNLEISYSTDLTNLDGLANVASVGGGLIVLHNDALNDLDGLSSVESVDGDVVVEGNDVLTTVSALASLTDVGGMLDINQNPVLEDISLGVRSVGDRLDLKSNPVLTAIDLPSLTSVGRSVEIVGNDALTELNLIGVAEVPGALHISTNEVLTDLTGLANLTDVGEEFWISTNASLEVLNGLENVRTVGGQLRVIHNPSLFEVSSLLGLTSVGGTVFFYDNVTLCQTWIDAFLDALGITDHDTYSNAAC